MTEPTNEDLDGIEEHDDKEDNVSSLGVKRIENHTHRHLFLLPATYTDPETGARVDFPAGVRLIPGLNTVPNKYLIALETKEVENAPVKGAKKNAPVGKRFPGRELIKQLLTPVTIQTVNGSHFGPQITIYEPDAAQVRDASDGPRMPSSLAELTPRGALELIKRVSDVKALRSWTKDKREPVAQAAMSRLNDIGR